VRVRGGSYRLGRLLRHRRRALAAGLAVTAAALVAAGPRAATDPLRAERTRKHPVTQPVRRHAPPVDMVTAPVRIADAATVRLLRPGDRVDVIAAGDPSTGGDARVIARGVRVTELPEPVEGTSESGALVVLSVPRAAAARLVGASATARLAVTLC
jgi:protein involved in polysaccharide export with SLBB domain